MKSSERFRSDVLLPKQQCPASTGTQYAFGRPEGVSGFRRSEPHEFVRRETEVCERENIGDMRRLKQDEWSRADSNKSWTKQPYFADAGLLNEQFDE